MYGKGEERSEKRKDRERINKKLKGYKQRRKERRKKIHAFKKLRIKKTGETERRQER